MCNRKTKNEHKECSKCNEIKSLNDFYNDKRRLDGKGLYCKDCIYKPKGNRHINWTKEIVTDEINKMKKKNLRITTSTVSTTLYTYVIKYFKTWENMIKELRAEENYYDAPTWTKKKIIDEIKMINDSGHTLKYTVMRKKRRSLFNTAIKFFGTWENAVIKSGIDYSYKKHKWNPQKIKEKIIEIHNDGEPLNTAHVNSKYSDLHASARYYFKSWEEAVKESGFDYDDIKIDAHILCDAGAKFECVLGDILTDLKITFSKGHNSKIRPDFVLDNHEWIDAKLSEWTVFDKRCETIDKYQPFCNSLTIIFLRGSKERDNQLNEKTRIISVYLLLKHLPEHLRGKYIEILSEIEENLHFMDEKIEYTKCKYCDNKALSRDMCNKHYQKWYRRNQVIPIREVIQLSSDGNYVRSWSTITHAVSEVKRTTTSNISACCRGKRKTTGGYRWMYKEDYDQCIEEQNKAV